MKKKDTGSRSRACNVFTFAGCGGDSGDKDKNQRKAKSDIHYRQLGCEDIEVIDNGKKVSEDTIKIMFGKNFSSVLKLTAYGDGSADINMMGDEGVI